MCDIVDVSIVNKTFQQIARGDDLYRATFLVRPKDVHIDGSRLRKSNAAILRIGSLATGDVTMNCDGDVGKVVAMWQGIPASTIFVQVDVYPTINDDLRLRSTTRSTRQFWDASTLIDTLIWLEESPGIIRIPIPAAILYKRM